MHKEEDQNVHRNPRLHLLRGARSARPFLVALGAAGLVRAVVAVLAIRDALAEWSPLKCSRLRDAPAMWEAPFAWLRARLREPGDKGRNDRGQLPAAEFLKMAKRVWTVEAQVKKTAGG